MPEILRKQLSSSMQLAVWRIEESEEFFEQQLMLDELEQEYLKSIKVESKRLQWLASRLLIRLLVNPSGQILMEWNAFGKPVVLNYDFETSISHSRDMVAVIVGDRNCGVDVEQLSNKILKIARKFVREDERDFLTKDKEIEYTTLIWGAKESLFKYIGGGGIDFKEHLQIMPFEISNSGFFQATVRHKKTQQTILLGYELLDGFTLVWVKP